MQTSELNCDICVVGSGLAGISAALASAEKMLLWFCSVWEKHCQEAVFIPVRGA